MLGSFCREGEECVFNHRIVSVKVPETVAMELKLLFQGFFRTNINIFLFRIISILI